MEYEHHMYPRRTTECTCEPDHTVTRLGHSRSCPHYNVNQFTWINRDRVCADLGNPTRVPILQWLSDGSYHTKGDCCQGGGRVCRKCGSPTEHYQAMYGSYDTACEVCDTSKFTEQVHDFEWATYCDDTMSTGVCECGAYEIGRSMSMGDGT